jgi:hypothetical protein
LSSISHLFVWSNLYFSKPSRLELFHFVFFFFLVVLGFELRATLAVPQHYELFCFLLSPFILGPYLFQY